MTSIFSEWKFRLSKCFRTSLALDHAARILQGDADAVNYMNSHDKAIIKRDWRFQARGADGSTAMEICA